MVAVFTNESIVGQKKYMITIFANMMINNEVRFNHLKDSFNSFEQISDNWLINIRGSLRQEVMAFLRERLGDRMIEFELLDEDRGWYNNSIEMLEKAKHKYVFLWIEDHINIAPPDVYDGIVREMEENKVDYLMYSWWMGGNSRKVFEVDNLQKKKFIDVVVITKSIWKKRLALGHKEHLVSLLGIFNKDFILKQLRREDGFKLPRLVTTFMFFIMIVLNKLKIKFNHGKLFESINSVFHGRLLKSPKNTPFEFEKSAFRFDVLPIRMGLSKEELFVCINDDLYIEGTQLIKRGLYPVKINLEADTGKRKKCDWGWQETVDSNDFYIIKKYFVNPGMGFSKSHCPNVQRIEVLPKITIIVQEGEVKIIARNMENKITSTESITIYSNISHKISAGSEGAMFWMVMSKEINNN